MGIMGHLVYWHIENRVCVVQAWGDVALDELTEISQDVTALVQAGEAPVHWIVDARQIASIPKSLGQVQKMAKVFSEPNLGWVLALTENHFMKFATSLVSQLSRVNYRAFNDAS